MVASFLVPAIYSAWWPEPLAFRASDRHRRGDRRRPSPGRRHQHGDGALAGQGTWKIFWMPVGVDADMNMAMVPLAGQARGRISRCRRLA